MNSLCIIDLALFLDRMATVGYCYFLDNPRDTIVLLASQIPSPEALGADHSRSGQYVARLQSGRLEVPSVPETRQISFLRTTDVT